MDLLLQLILNNSSSKYDNGIIQMSHRNFHILKNLNWVHLLLSASNVFAVPKESWVHWSAFQRDSFSQDVTVDVSV